MTRICSAYRDGVAAPAALVSPGDEVRRRQLLGAAEVATQLVVGEDGPPVAAAAGPEEALVAAPYAIRGVRGELRCAAPHGRQAGVLDQLLGPSTTDVVAEDPAQPDQLARDVHLKVGVVE